MGWLTRRITSPYLLLAAMLVSFGVILGCAVGAGELLELAERPGGSTPFDSSITSWMVAHRTHGLTTLARVFSTMGSQTVLAPAAGIVAVVLLLQRRLVLAGSIVAAWGGASVLYSLTKHFVQRQRPPSEIWLTNVGRSSSSFPSGHATQSLATFLALVLVGAVWLPRARWPGTVVAIVLAAGVGWSRVYLGVHWSTDVGAGWLLGAAVITIVTWLSAGASAMQQRHGRRSVRQP
jgi:undecaprenyl-diphosphatase